MKKTLLSLVAMLVCICTINAEEVTFDFKTEAYGLPNDKNTFVTNETAVNGDITLSFSKTSGSGFRMWSDGLRVYKTGKGNASIKISIPNAIVTSIDMTVASKLGTVKVGDKDFTYTTASKTYSWSGSETDPTIVITSTSGNYAITTLKITYEANDPSDTRGSADIKFPESSYIVDEGSEFTAPVPTKATTSALTYTSSNTAVATVDATTGAVTIVAPGSTKITATAAENTEFKAGEGSYTLDVLKIVNSIAETMEITDNTLKLRINYPLTVAFKNFNNTFACNGNDFIQVYGNNQPAYTAGDVIPAGWIGCYDLYGKTTPEILNPIGMPEATENNGFTPAKVSEITTADVNKVVTLENVVFAEATPSTKDNFTGTVNGSEVTMRNNYTIAGVEAGTYDVTGVVAIYREKPQFYVTGYEKVVDTGIADIVADENAPVEYFNLQGIRVENPENGLYIRRQGNKVTKVIVK
ncbi:Ig-like domain-containing protein [Duncaniella muris]|uniref:Ig-like domain-containing protein n=1 Tax=Duncaniella muris TaxID=2094150 RepID=UPI0014342E32|nr:Ig-like domain-containing protein [Duncaniella muris]GFI52941.1 hypothetical protein IMSAGC021_01250 [Muribaculaceae bacterium]